VTEEFDALLTCHGFDCRLIAQFREIFSLVPDLNRLSTQPTGLKSGMRLALSSDEKNHMTGPMTHAILGAGGVGGTIGACLAHLGDSVTLIVQREALAQYPERCISKARSATSM